MRALARTVAEQAAIMAKDVAQDVVKEGNESLDERLKTYDFPRVEAKTDRGLAEARADREAMETRIRERLDRVDARMDRMGDRMERMEARILEAVLRRSGAGGDADEAEA